MQDFAIISLLKMKRIVLILTCVAITGLLILYFVIIASLHADTNRRLMEAKVLVGQIDAFKTEFGSYPADLSQLPNKPHEESTSFNSLERKFNYILEEDSSVGNFYLLQYHEALGVEVTYDSRTKKWSFDD
jgi:hypothetical protein